MIDFADVDELVELLNATEVRSADVDPAKVNVPGVLVQVVSFAEDLLAGTTLKVNLVLVSADTDFRRAMAQLQVLYTQVTPVLDLFNGPTGDVTAATIQLPADPAPLPALVVPLELLTTPTTEGP